MRVLKVIHGFPPDYMAGSEVYSYNLVRSLAKRTEAFHVFTRVENDFASPYQTYDEIIEGFHVYRVNKPKRDYYYEEKFEDASIEKLFENYVLKINPDIIHFGHLSHLSTNLITIARKKFQLPVIYTIHDFWLHCVKGQLIDKNNNRCSGPSPQKCHECSPYYTSVNRVASKLEHMKNIMNFINVFLVPSHTVRNFFISQGIPKNKLIYSKYGFNNDFIQFRKRSYKNSCKVRFGFMGRIIPTKGIHVLVKAFEKIDVELLVYGDVGIQKRFLEKSNIIFKGGYDNQNLNEIFDNIDVLIVPSIWLENSPLVIQEAFLAGVPVITSDIGGMKELVKEGVNGYLFSVGDPNALKKIVLNIHQNPEILNKLNISKSDVRTIDADADFILSTYLKLLC